MNHQKTPRGLGACAEMKVFPPFRLDLLNLCLWRAEARMPLTPKAFDILRYLVERADRLVTHDELLDALWPETYVNPEGIRKYILEIRKVLGDQPKHSLFIQTVPKRGYQFVAKVADGFMQPANPPADPWPTRDRRTHWVAVAIYVGPFPSSFESYPISQPGTRAAIKPELPKEIGEGRYDKE